MDYNNNNPYTQQNNNYNYYGQNQFIRNPGQAMAVASMILGIASIFTLLTFYLPVILGSLAIVFAILSKGYGKKMLNTAKIGIRTAYVGIGLIILALSAFITFFLSLNGDTLIEFGRQVDRQFEQQTGQDIEDFAGTSYEEIMKKYAQMLGK